MKKLIFLIGTGVVCSISAIAQNDIDAMRYSQLTFGGTARFASMAGSMGALGGDMSGLSYNPAGIGVYRKGEISITPVLFSQSTSSTYNSTNARDRKLNLALGNIGIVGAIPLNSEKNGGWEFINFAFTYNQTNNFNSRINIQGYSHNSSLLDNYVAAANGNASSNFDSFSTNLAYQTYLINPIGIPNQYSHVLPNYGELQRKYVDSKGYMGEGVLNMGANFRNKLFIGGTIGFVKIRYNESSTYSESSDTTHGFRSFSLDNSLSTTGKGYNLKLGVIVKPTDWLNIGVAIHTPTGIMLTDKYSSTITSDVDTSGVATTFTAASPKGSFNYTATTPWRAIGSIGFIIKKVAVINAEYEYVDYKYAQLNSTPNVFTDVNTTIRNKYSSAGNIRVGAEYRWDPFAVRIGYAFYGSPFRSGENANANRTSYTAGVGYRYKHFFMDMAYVYSMYTEYNYLYDSGKLTSIKNDYAASSVLFTVGAKF